MDVFSRSFIVVSLALVMLAACASDGSGRDDSGVVALGKMRVTIGPGWQRVPDKDVPEKQGWLRVYSRDGLGTDRLHRSRHTGWKRPVGQRGDQRFDREQVLQLVLHCAQECDSALV